MTNGYVIVVCDTETTGMDPEVHDVIEISMCRLILNKDGNHTREQKTWLLKALNPSSIQDDALAVNGHKKEDITHFSKFGKENYLQPADVIADIENWINEDDASAIDRVFAGQNPMFDVQHLQALWRKLGSTNTFPFALDKGNRIIDTKQLAILIDLCTGRRRQYYNLSSLVKSFKVKKGKAHKASEDVRMTTDLLLAYLEPLQSVIAEKFSDCYNDEKDDE